MIFYALSKNYQIFILSPSFSWPQTIYIIFSTFAVVCGADLFLTLFVIVPIYHEGLNSRVNEHQVYFHVSTSVQNKTHSKCFILYPFVLNAGRVINMGRQVSYSSFINKEGVFVCYTLMITKFQKQPSRGVLKVRCPENMQQIYRRTPIPKRDFNSIEI